MRDAPFAFVAETANRLVLQAVNGPARAAGVAAGLSLADARAICPQLLTHPAEPRAHARALTALARVMEQFSPLIAYDAPDGLFADMSGVAHLFGGETALLARVTGRLERFGLCVRAALADTPGAAHALARYGSGCTLVDVGAHRAALASLPVAALRVSDEVAQSCRRLGLQTIGDLIPLQRSALAARFGLETVNRLDQALGHAAEPLRYIRFVPPLRETLAFAEPIGRTDDVERALTHLLERLCVRLEREDKGLRLVSFTIERVDSGLQTVTITTSRPNRSPAALFRLFRDRLDGLDAGFGIERVHLEAERCEPLAAVQVKGLERFQAKWKPVRRRKRDQQKTTRANSVSVESEFAQVDKNGQASTADDDLIDRLVNRFGHDRVLRLAPAESHLPERAWVAFSAAVASLHPAWSAPPTPRPLRLLARPHPLKAEDNADHRRPPAAISWDGRVARLTPLAGPERIEPEWWRDDPAWRSGARDYWWVRADDGLRPSGPHPDGLRLWLFRVGAEDAWGAWFLHGFGE